MAVPLDTLKTLDLGMCQRVAQGGSALPPKDRPVGGPFLWPAPAFGQAGPERGQRREVEVPMREDWEPQ